MAAFRGQRVLQVPVDKGWMGNMETMGVPR